MIYYDDTEECENGVSTSLISYQTVLIRARERTCRTVIILSSDLCENKLTKITDLPCVAAGLFWIIVYTVTDHRRKICSITASVDEVKTCVGCVGNVKRTIRQREERRVCSILARKCLAYRPVMLLNPLHSQTLSTRMNHFGTGSSTWVSSGPSCRSTPSTSSCSTGLNCLKRTIY